MNLGYHVYVLATQSPDVDRTKPLLYGTVLVLLVPHVPAQPRRHLDPLPRRRRRAARRATSRSRGAMPPPQAHTSRDFESELRELRAHSLAMGARCERALQLALKAFWEGSAQLAAEVEELDRHIDRDEMDIDALVLRILALRQPVAYDLRFLAGALRLVTDLERIGDEAVNIAERAKEEHGTAKDKVRGELKTMGEQAQEMLRDALDAFVQGEATRAEQVLVRDDAVDELYGAHHPRDDRVHDPAPGAGRRGHPRHPRREVPRAGRRPRDQHRRGGHLHGARRGRAARAHAPAAQGQRDVTRAAAVVDGGTPRRAGANDPPRTLTASRARHVADLCVCDSLHEERPGGAPRRGERAMNANATTPRRASHISRTCTCSTPGRAGIGRATRWDTAS